ncbi:serine/threonine-protein phosphatase [Streptomyces somaliensis]|nr:serine/threonine-protein phosphatase [Streptomyces somaliensis]
MGQLYQLLHLAAALTETVGVQDVVDLVADQITPAFGAQGLVLSSLESGRLRITGSRGYPRHVVDRLDGLPVDTHLTPAGQALSTGVPSFFGHPDEMARIYPEAPQVSGKQAWAFLPMVASGGRSASACSPTTARAPSPPRSGPCSPRWRASSRRPWTGRGCTTPSTSSRTACSRRCCRTPCRPRPGCGSRPATCRATLGMDIGGDFYDLLRVDATTVAAVIGDVQGHNVAAAALMGQVRTAVHTHTTAGAAPEEVLARTNRLLLDLDPGLFTTCLYARIDLGQGRVRMANAGHPPPLLRCPDGRARRLDVPPGPALGIDPAAAYPVTEVDLAPGAVLVLYTDGLVETPGADIERAVDRLAEHLAVWGAEEPDRLLELLLDHAGPADRRTDDIALLLVRIEEAAAQAGPH